MTPTFSRSDLIGCSGYATDDAFWQRCDLRKLGILACFRRTLSAGTSRAICNAKGANQMAQDQLQRELIGLSGATAWVDAAREWKLQSIWRSQDNETCLCGHYPIREICEIQNVVTLEVAEVGNCCVQQFLGIQSERLFSSLRRVLSGVSTSFNQDVILLAYERGAINRWEAEFYSGVWRKRNLSYKQESVKARINTKLLRWFQHN